MQFKVVKNQLFQLIGVERVDVTLYFMSIVDSIYKTISADFYLGYNLD